MLAINQLKVTKVASHLGLKKMLTFRPAGKKAKEYIQTEITKLQSGEAMELDFSGIELCDVSFVDEMLIEVQLYLWTLSKNVLMFISNINDSTMDNLKPALAYREKNGQRVPILFRKGKEFSYVGTLEPGLEEAFRQVVKNKQITARDIASSDKVNINSASNKLKKLYDYRLVLRDEVVDQNGRQYTYSMPK